LVLGLLIFPLIALVDAFALTLVGIVAWLIYVFWVFQGIPVLADAGRSIELEGQ
jgi:hypothetical protein